MDLTGTEKPLTQARDKYTIDAYQIISCFLSQTKAQFYFFFPKDKRINCPAGVDDVVKKKFLFRDF